MTTRPVAALADFHAACERAGVPPEHRERIFDRFYQAGNARDGRAHGTGLGLSIVAGLVQEMKGHVEASSPEGRPGATFIVELPALQESA